MAKSLGWCRNSWQATSTASIHLVDIGLVHPNQFLKFKKPGKIRSQNITSSSIWCISSPQTKLRMSCTLSKSQCCQWGFHHLNNLHKLISKHPHNQLNWLTSSLSHQHKNLSTDGEDARGCQLLFEQQKMAPARNEVTPLPSIGRCKRSAAALVQKSTLEDHTKPECLRE